MLNGCLHDANAILFVIKPNYTPLVDPYCEPEIASSIPATETLYYLSVDELDTNLEIKYKGARTDVIKVTGRCVKPLYFPDTFETGCRFELSYEPTELGSGKRFPCYLRKVPRSRLGLDKVFGDYVELEVRNVQD